MKILIVRLFPDEVNINNYNLQEIGLAKALVRKGNQCDIVYYTKGKDRQEKIKVDENKEINIFWTKGFNFLKNGLYGNKIIKLANDYDIVQSSEYDQIYNLKLNKKIGNKLIIYHGPYYADFNKGYNLKCKVFDMLFLNKKYKKIRMITKSKLAKTFLQSKGFEEVTTIGVGLDTERFIDNNVAGNLENTEKSILYIGRIEERRNIRFLIEILKEIVKDKKDVKLTMVGKGNKEYVSEIFNYAKKLEVIENITYIESAKQEELAKIYKKSQVFLLPTSYEIFGMVLLEAMYFGVPTITTLNGGSSTIIENGKNGIVCSLSEKEKWKNEIIKIFDNKEYRKYISENASSTINKKYNWNILSEKFLEVYESKRKEN